MVAVGMFLLWPMIQRTVMRWETDPKATSSSSNPWMELLQTPIEFYGVVLDQEGDPVPGAKVSATIMDNLNKGTPLAAISDSKGRFAIHSKGATISVRVEKSGYYFVDKGSLLHPSSQGFDFGADTGRGIYQPDPASPTIFHLRKAGNPIPLERLQAQPNVPRDDSSVAISLSKTSKVELQIKCLTLEDETQPPNAPYDWHCEITIEGGGIQEADDEHRLLASLFRQHFR